MKTSSGSHKWIAMAFVAILCGARPAVAQVESHPETVVAEAAATPTGTETVGADESSPSATSAADRMPASAPAATTEIRIPPATPETQRRVDTWRRPSAVESDGVYRKLKKFEYRAATREVQKSKTNIKPREILAEHAMAYNQYKKAIQLLAEHSDRLSRKGLLMLARAYQRTDDHLNRVRVLEFAASEHPRDYVIFFELGMAYADKGEKDLALAKFSEAATINRRFRPAYEAWYAELIKDAQKRYEARALLNDMIEVFGPEARFLNELCFLYYDAGFIRQAKEHCQLAIRHNPELADNYVYLGLTYKNSGDPESAKKTIRNAGKRFPASELAQWANGRLDQEQNNLLGAEKAFEQAVKIDAESARAHLGLAEVRFQLKKYAEALNSYAEHCRIQRQISSEFQTAAGKLLRTDPNWNQKYRGAMASCSKE